MVEQFYQNARKQSSKNACMSRAKDLKISDHNMGEF